MPTSLGGNGALASSPISTSVDHRSAYLDGCITVHDQGNTSWCVAHATTAALEAQHCSPQGHHKKTRVSAPHLWYLGHGQVPFTSCNVGWSVRDAVTVVVKSTEVMVAKG